LTLYKQTSRANSENLANKHSKKTWNPNLFCARADRPAHRRATVRTADRPPSLFGVEHMPPCLLVELSEPKATNSMYHIGFLRHLATY
jgi:hypothetical protein